MILTIAGANSFIGKRILRFADHINDINVIAAVRRDSLNLKKSHKCVSKVIECDMNEYDNIGELAGKGDCFIDLSWIGSRGSDRQNADMQKFNYISNMKAMRSMADIGYKILVSAGSQAEYGLCNGTITEETPLNPNTEYGRYKVQIFHEVEELSNKYGIRFIEPRYFSLYGPGDYEKTLIMGCISKMQNGSDVILNECTQEWDYLYIDDAVKALFNLIQSDNVKGVYNFATGNYRMIREFVEDIHAALNSNSKLVFEPNNDLYKGLIINLRPDVTKLKRDAKWEASTDFKSGILKTAADFNGLGNENLNEG